MLFDQILSLVPCAVFWKDVDGIFEGCNEQFLKFSGLKTKDQLLGKDDKQLPWANLWEKYYKDDQYVISSGETITHIEQVSLPDRIITAHTTKTPWLKNGKCIGVLGVIYDISELIDAKEKAEIANHLKTEFIQNMQHDIRTPASGVWSVLGMLVEEETNPEKRKTLILLRDSAKQLYDICNDVIDFDRAERGEVPITSKKLSVNDIVSNVIDLNKAIAFKKQLDLSSSVDNNIPNVLKGDQHRISHILINLVSNAMKFTQRGKITLTAKLIKLEEKRAVIQFEIRDTGMGISPEKKNFIYEKFTRGTPANQGKYQGSGLGLQIVKKFVSDMDGEIDVESEMDRGTTFYIILSLERPLIDKIYDAKDEQDEMDNLGLPINEIPKALESNFQEEQKIAKQLIKVLLIEDDRLAQVIALSELKSLNCESALAPDVATALKFLENQHFDLVLSDIGLPDGTGIDIIRAVKSEAKHLNYNTYFVALTAHSDEEKKKEAIESGFLEIVAKPLAIDKLKDILNIYTKESI